MAFLHIHFPWLEAAALMWMTIEFGEHGKAIDLKSAKAQ